MKLRAQTVTVVGLGRSGSAAVDFLLKKGARVRVTDANLKKETLVKARRLGAKGVAIQLGTHTESFVEGSRFVVKSPGVRPDSLPIAFAKRRHIPVLSEIDLAALFCGAPITAVTGSNGKTTTCHLVFEMLRAAQRRPVLCGNVGSAFLSRLGRIRKDTPVVLELSSFQLEDSAHLHPHTAVVLNVCANHLDRHGSMESYLAAKRRIFMNQTEEDFLILNADDPRVRRMADKARPKVIFISASKKLRSGVSLERGRVVARIDGFEAMVFDPTRFVLAGRHNLQNIMAAIAAAVVGGVGRESICRCLETFKTLEHRIEPAGEAGGIHFINDSKSTTVESTRAAILAVPSPMVLIAGGRDKGVSFKEIEPLILRRVKAAVLYGEARAKIAAAWPQLKNVVLEDRFEDAVRTAYRLAAKGERVLLSPMCTSFDQFTSFEQRGEFFKALVRTFAAPRRRPVAHRPS